MEQLETALSLLSAEILFVNTIFIGNILAETES